MRKQQPEKREQAGAAYLLFEHNKANGARSMEDKPLAADDLAATSPLRLPCGDKPELRPLLASCRSIAVIIDSSN